MSKPQAQARSALKLDLFADAAQKQLIATLGDPLQVPLRPPTQLCLPASQEAPWPARRADFLLDILSNARLLDTGTCTVRADQAGNYRYLPAPQVERSFAVVRKAVAGAAVPGMAGTATATLSGGGALCSLQATGGFGPAVHKPPQMDAPHGQFSFTAEHCDSTPVTITLQYPEPLPANVAFRKPDGAGGWFDPQDAATLLNLQVSNGRRTVSYDITDTSLGDANSVTGIIEDPLIPVVAAGDGRRRGGHPHAGRMRAGAAVGFGGSAGLAAQGVAEIVAAPAAARTGICLRAGQQRRNG